jgi:hypothetical protein
VTQLRFVARLAWSCTTAAADVLTHHLAKGADALRLSDHRRQP